MQFSGCRLRFQGLLARQHACKLLLHTQLPCTCTKEGDMQHKSHQTCIAPLQYAISMAGSDACATGCLHMHAGPKSYRLILSLWPVNQHHTAINSKPFNVQQNKSKLQHTLCTVRGGLRCWKPPSGALLQEVTNRINALCWSSLRLDMTCTSQSV